MSIPNRLVLGPSDERRQIVWATARRDRPANEEVTCAGAGLTVNVSANLPPLDISPRMRPKQSGSGKRLGGSEWWGRARLTESGGSFGHGISTSGHRFSTTHAGRPRY